jgi:thiamine biosynthesis lipoprotein
LRWLAALAAALVACAAPGASGPAPLVAVSDGRVRMGTVLELSLWTRDPEAARDALEAAFARAAELEAQLSRYRSDSDVSRLSRSAGRGFEEVAPATADLLRLSRDDGALTRGAFDVTVGPLVELWTRAARRDRAPDAGEIDAARRLVGADGLRIDAQGRAALARPGMSVDLGGIAKGYALDEIVRLLRERGFASALLSFGQSSAWALGAPPGEPAWCLLLRAPAGGFSGDVCLRDQAFSVSSSFGRASEIAGRRYGHVIDPRSGRALERAAQASVVAASATLAEALSTALVVLEPREGIAVVEGLPAAEALVAVEGAAPLRSSGFDRATGFETLPSGLSSGEGKGASSGGGPRPVSG